MNHKWFKNCDLLLLVHQKFNCRMRTERNKIYISDSWSFFHPTVTSVDFSMLQFFVFATRNVSIAKQLRFLYAHNFLASIKMSSREKRNKNSVRHPSTNPRKVLLHTSRCYHQKKTLICSSLKLLSRNLRCLNFFASSIRLLSLMSFSIETNSKRKNEKTKYREWTLAGNKL